MKNMSFKVNSAGLLRDIASNPECATLRIPIKIFGRLLHDVGKRAAQLNDPKLNALMCRLAIYELADPESQHYDPAIAERIIAAGERQ